MTISKRTINNYRRTALHTLTTINKDSAPQVHKLCRIILRLTQELTDMKLLMEASKEVN